MSKYFLVSILSLLMVACGGSKNAEEETFEELDLMPMYGSTADYGYRQKTPEQLETDRIFLMKSDEVQPSRQQACIDYIDFGWHYLKRGNLETAMKRSNQAWQLDSTNPNVYILFAAILNAYAEHTQAIDMLDRALTIAPDNVDVYDLLLSESISLYRQTNDNQQIKDLIIRLNKVNIENDSLKQKIETIKTDALEFME